MNNLDENKYWEDFLKLMAIFLPHVHKSIIRLYPTISNTAVASFAHYTSAENVIKIMRNRNLWMRNTNCMNDFTEISHGIDMIMQYLVKSSSDNGRFDLFRGLLSEVDCCHGGIATETTKQFVGLLENISDFTYISSICEHDYSENTDGNLSMWRSYGAGTANVAIVVNIPFYTGAAASLNIDFFPINYSNRHDFQKNIEYIKDKIIAEKEFIKQTDGELIRLFIFKMLEYCVICTKHSGFSGEKEWRGIYSPKRIRNALMIPEVQTINGTPQIIHKVPMDGDIGTPHYGLNFKNIFDRLIIGPSQFQEVMKNAFTEELKNAGIPNPEEKIFLSTIPIRT